MSKLLELHGLTGAGAFEATRWLKWYGVGLASADRLPVVVRIPAGPLGSLKRPAERQRARTTKKDWRWGVRGCLCHYVRGMGSRRPHHLATRGWLCLASRILVISRVLQGRPLAP